MYKINLILNLKKKIEAAPSKTYLDDDEGGQRLGEAVLGSLVQAPDPRDEGLPVGARHGDPQHQLQEQVTLGLERLAALAQPQRQASGAPPVLRAPVVKLGPALGVGRQTECVVPGASRSLTACPHPTS